MTATATVTKSQLAEINEIKHLASFSKSMHPRVATAKFLKYIGFDINGLEGSTRSNLGSSVMHRLLQHKTLPWAVCSCGRWEVSGTEAKLEHARHRSAVRPS